MPEPAPSWTRDTAWRQGHVLPADATRALNLTVGSDPQGTRVVVISHDCDIANDQLDIEPHVEVIVGRRVSAADGNFTFAKGTRVLHLEYIHQGDERAYVELTATGKMSVSKSQLAAYSPDPAYELSPRQLACLQSWLAARYRRSGFPDEFNRRMGSRVTKLDERLISILSNEKYAVISAMYFLVDEGREVDRSDGSPYRLSIVLAYDPTDDPLEASDAANEAADKITEAFEHRAYDADAQKWNHVQLLDCSAQSEAAMTVYSSHRMRERRAEHVSLKLLEE